MNRSGVCLERYRNHLLQSGLDAVSVSLCFGLQMSAITVFTPAHINSTKWKNEPEFNLHGLSTAAVKTPYVCLSNTDTHNYLRRSFKCKL